MRTDLVQPGRHVSKSVSGDSIHRKSAYGVRAFVLEGSFNVSRRGEPLAGDSRSRVFDQARVLQQIWRRE